MKDYDKSYRMEMAAVGLLNLLLALGIRSTGVGRLDALMGEVDHIESYVLRLYEQ